MILTNKKKDKTPSFNPNRNKYPLVPLTLLLKQAQNNSLLNRRDDIF